jgi:endo-beta-N-acetylglucosaminidase D
MLCVIKKITEHCFAQEKTPNTGVPGTTHTNPGSGQERKYGSDGKPEYDIDWDHDHGQGVPHGHNWDDGKRGPGVSISPWPQDRTP